MQRLAVGLRDAISQSGIHCATPTQGPLLGLYLSREEFVAPTSITEASPLCDNGMYRDFFHAMLRRGIALAPGSYEIIFVSLAHSDADIDRTIAAAGEAAQEAFGS